MIERDQIRQGMIALWEDDARRPDGGFGEAGRRPRHDPTERRGTNAPTYGDEGGGGLL